MFFIGTQCRFTVPNGMAIFPWGPSNGGSNARGMKKIAIFENISVYLGNDTRQGHSYYGRRIWNSTQAFRWYDFEWPWMTLSDLAK